MEIRSTICRGTGPKSVFIFIMLSSLCSLLYSQTNDGPPMLPAITGSFTTNAVSSEGPGIVGEPYVVTRVTEETTNGVERVTVTNEITQLPFMLYTGVDTNGRPILEVPASWMLGDKPLPALRVTFYDKITDAPVWSAEYVGTGNTSYVKWEIEE